MTEKRPIKTESRIIGDSMTLHIEPAFEKAPHDMRKITTNHIEEAMRDKKSKQPTDAAKPNGDKKSGDEKGKK